MGIALVLRCQERIISGRSEPLRRSVLLLFLAAGSLLLACSAKPITHSAAAEVNGAETVSIKAVSFNVLYGAGSSRRFDENIPQRFRDRNRMPELLAFLKLTQPDLLAVQEAGGWEDGVAAEIAASLNMSYVLAPDPWDLNVILFSRYPILEAAYVSRSQGFNGVVLRAAVAATPNSRLQVFVTHFYSMSSQTRSCQVDALLEMMAPYAEERVLLLGDMNFRPQSNEGQKLSSAGWQLAALSSWPIDQIWLDPRAGVTAGDWWAGFTLPRDISDHLPIGVDLTFDVGRRELKPNASRGNVKPAAMQYACAVPTPRPRAP
jgi:endonuclease/exonuclease/phosphatase family metal-dependent hydrolase